MNSQKKIQISAIVTFGALSGTTLGDLINYAIERQQILAHEILLTEKKIGVEQTSQAFVKIKEAAPKQAGDNLSYIINELRLLRGEPHPLKKYFK